LFANQGFVTYVWYYNGSIINGATNYYYVATQNGDYNIISFDANGCDVEAVAFNVLTSVNSIQNPSEIVIYPNPVNDLMKIRGVKGAEISLFNIIGELIINDMHLLDASSGISTADVSLLPAGVYIVEMKFADRTVHTKIIKQ
jgi:hypothetical protein